MALGVTVNKASLVLSPDYDGSDESLRIGFFGASITDTATTFEVGGVWRFFDSAPAGRIFGAVASKGPGIASVAYDGTNLAAGAYLTNFVYRSADAMAATPTFLPGRNYKQIGVNDPAVPDIVLLKFDGATLYGAKSGDASAISKSLDYGNTWSDYTMLDNAITVADDILMSATGDPWYLAAHDAITTAIYRISMFAVTRVLCVYPADAAAFILRGISTNPGVLYAADQTALNTIFYTADGGVSRWYKRIAPATIADLAVESQSVIYIGNGANVYKSTNSGFTWGLPVSTKLPGGAIYSMLSVGDSKLIIGGTAGGVNWSTDGGATWFVSFGIGGTNVIVAASGLAAGDYVFAANTAASPGVTGTDVYRAAIGPANPFGEFKSMQAPNVAVVAEIITGIVYTNGVLYIVSTDPLTGVFGTSYLTRTLMPTFPGTHIGVFWSQYAEAGEVFNRGISDLRASSGAPGDIMLYGIDTNFQLIYYFQDTLALNAPVLTGPTDKSLIQLTSALLGSSQNVNFTWNRISLATSYFLLVALDSFFTQPVALTAPVQPIVSSAPVVSAIVPGVNFQPGLTYYWAVVSFAPLSSAMSEVRSFTVQQVAASVPNISSPLNGAIGVGTNPSFSWSPISGTTKYEFQLSDTTNFDIAMFSEQLSNTGIQPTGLTLKAGKTYFWRVRAYEPTQGDWSSIANFTVAVPATTTPPPVTVTTNPPAQITVTTPPPVTVILPTTETKTISPAYIWAIIIIGAVLVIAVIVLIVRTRRSV
jgi:hypothetical protein